MTKYKHALDLAFEVISDKEDGSDITEMMIAVALNRRVAQLLEEKALMESCGCPFDTYLIEEKNRGNNHN